MTTGNLLIAVDTDVVSYLFKKDTRAIAYRPHLAGKIPVLAAQTKAELELWTLERNWGTQRRQKLAEHLRDFVVAPFDEDLCRLWAVVTDGARRQGVAISCADAWVAATALFYGVPLVTHNAKDYAGVPGLVVITEK